jgi:hypothetical protein
VEDNASIVSSISQELPECLWQSLRAEKSWHVIYDINTHSQTCFSDVTKKNDSFASAKYHFVHFELAQAGTK